MNAAAYSLFEETVLRNPFIPVTPSARQASFLSYMGPEAMYGGSAGGGKSFALLMAALQFVTVPGYAALILRKSFKDLDQPNALIPISKEWLSGKADWNQTAKRWTFPSGATLTFGYLEHKDDVYQYQGAAWAFCGFDEATQFAEPSYLYLFSRLRKPANSPVPIRMRAGSNPGGRGHEWVYNRFIAPEGYRKKFVPAKLHDNPHLDAAAYVRGMMNLDEVTRAQLLSGDWDAYQGGRFRKEWFRLWEHTRDLQGNLRFILRGDQATEGKKRLARLEEIGSPYIDDEAGVNANDCWRFVSADTAATEKETSDYTAMGVWAVTPAMDLLLLHVLRAKLDIEKIVPALAAICRDYKPEWVAIEEMMGSLAIIRAAQRHPTIPTVLPLPTEGKSKLVRATPAIILTQSGKVYLPRPGKTYPWVSPFLGECVRFTGGVNPITGEEEPDAYDDQVDMFSTGVGALNRMGLSSPIVVTPDQIQQEIEESRGPIRGRFLGRR